MSVSKIQATLQYDIKKVWHYITSLEDYTWRSDIKCIEVIEDGKVFKEYSKEGYETIFTITIFEPYQQYQFMMENDNMYGCWKGYLKEENGITIIEFMEDVKAKKILMKPFVKMYLKKQQEKYVHDLKHALNHAQNNNDD